VMAGFIAGFDGDTPESIVAMADRLYEIGVDVPFLSVLTPYKGTALWNELEDEGRLLSGGGWRFFNGFLTSVRLMGVCLVASVVIGCEQIAPLEQNVQAAMIFRPISESDKQRLQEKVAPSRSTWENFLRTHEDSVAV